MTIPAPDHADLPYGPHPRNVLDLWRAKRDTPAPLFVWFHGGGFIGGEKTLIFSSLITRALEQGISVASANYRLSQQAPFPAAYLDGGRVVQMLRATHRAWDIDPQRIVIGGSSAGGGLSLWLGYHADLADPTSSDFIARASSRPNGLVCIAAQSSYDPNFIRTLIPGPTYLEPFIPWFFGIRPDELETERARTLFAEGSAITHVTPGAPPTLLFYDQPNQPLTEQLTTNEAIHHVRFGEVLKEKLDACQVPCLLKYRENYPPDADICDCYAQEAIAFMQQFMPNDTV